MSRANQRCINVKSAVALITTTEDHPYCQHYSMRNGSDLFDSKGIFEAYVNMLNRCFIKQNYFFHQSGYHKESQAMATDRVPDDIEALFSKALTKASLVLRDIWLKLFKRHCNAINWEKFCLDGIMELKMISSLSPGDNLAAHGEQNQKINHLKTKLDSAFNDFYARSNQCLRQMIAELKYHDTTPDKVISVLSASILKGVFSFDDARIMCLMLRDMCQLDILQAKLVKAKAVFWQNDFCHLIEYERHIHGLFIAQLNSYPRLLGRYKGNTHVRDWSYISEFFTGLHARSIVQYQRAVLVSSMLRGVAISGKPVGEFNRDLLTWHVSLLHRQIRIFFIHDLVMRYLIRRYFTKSSKPKLTVYPFERPGELDDERIRFFVWLVNRSLMNNASYEFNTALDDAEFWRQVLAHCAALSPSTFVAQLFKYVAPLGTRFLVTIHDLLDYVEWLCSYDPWYMCYSNGIIERFRQFSENKLQKQFSALYESECLLFYILIGNRLRKIEDKIKFLRERPELQAFKTRHASGFCADENPPSMTMPIFNWFNLSSNLFNYGVYYETLDWCTKTVQQYFAFMSKETKQRISRQSSFSSSSSSDARFRSNEEAGGSAARKRPFSQLNFSKRDSFIDMVMQSNFGKRARRKENTANAPAEEPDNIGSGNGEHHNEDSYQDSRRLIRHHFYSSNGELNLAASQQDILGRSPANKRFVVSLLQNCMNFLNDLCLMYNGSLIHKCCAENTHNYHQSSFKDRLKQSNDVWKNDPELSIYNISWKNVDLHELEENCYRDKSEERVSKAIGNTLAACSTSQINVNYLRFRSDGKHSYVIFNVMLKRYEIAAPSLMYLLSLDYKNWHLTDSDCYPSSVDPRVRDYISIALGEIDTFVEAIMPIDALSMMLNSDLIREKSIGASSTPSLRDRLTHPDRVNKGAEVVSPSCADKCQDAAIAGELATRDKQSHTENEISNDQAAGNSDSANESIADKNGEDALATDDVGMLPDDIGEDKSYVDFTLDRSEFFELSQHIRPHWIYRYFERSLQKDHDRGFSYIILLVVQMVHHYGLWILERESFVTMMTEELLLSSLPQDCALRLAARKKTSVSGGHPVSHHPELAANSPAENRTNRTAGVESHSLSTMRYDDRCNLSRVLEDQFQSCLALNEQTMNLYRSSYQREPAKLLSSAPELLTSSLNDTLVTTAAQEIEWHSSFKSNDALAADHRPQKRDLVAGSVVRDLLIEQDMRHFFSSTLHNIKFYDWLTSRSETICLTDVLDIGDTVFVRIFAVFVYVIRVISKQQSCSGLAEAINETRENSLARHITSRARTLFCELQLTFPCRFIASRGTINFSDAFVDYLDRRILTKGSRPAGRRPVNPANEQPRVSIDNGGDLLPEDVDLFGELLESFAHDNNASIEPTVYSSQQSNQARDSLNIRNIPYLRESALCYKTRQSISYFIFFIYIFCNCDLSVTLYMFRFLASFLYPGPWAKTVAIVQGSSNSGKSNMFNLVRSFYNSDMAVLNPKALTGPKDSIGTEFLLMCENFVCQTEELKEVEAETIKTMTSDTPLQARAFHSQRQQTVGILASMVITLNQMFRVVSDEGVLERLRVIFRVTHRHLELVRRESDMTRVNCGASMNVSHQFMRRIFPRGIVADIFQRGMFYTMMNWCPSQVTSPEDRFIHADRVACRYLQTLLEADLPNEPSIYELSAKYNFNNVEISQAFDRSWQNFCLKQEEALPSEENLLLATTKKINAIFFKDSSPDAPFDLSQFTLDPVSRSMIEHYVQKKNSFTGLLNLSQSKIEMRMSHSYQYSNCAELHGQYSRLFNELRSHCNLVSYLANTLSDSHNLDRSGSAVEQLSLPCVNDDEYDDNHVNLMVKPYILALYLADLHSNIDSFVRFQNTHKVTASQLPIRKEVLQYQLKVFVDRFNATISDVKYRVKFNEFFDRFETEYERFKYRDPRTNQIVPNRWAISVRQLSDN